MRMLATVLLVGLICLTGGYYAGLEVGQRARVSSAPAALLQTVAAGQGIHLSDLTSAKRATIY